MSASNHKTSSGPYTLLSADITRDPYPLYSAIRATSPVYFDAQLGRWLITGYDEAVAVLGDPRFSSKMAVQAFRADADAAQSPAARYFASTMVANDPPAHTRLRNLANKAFTPRVVEQLRARIQRLIDALLDAVQASGQMEVMRDLAYPLPLRVIAELLGVEPEMSAQLKQWSNEIVKFVGTPNATPEMLAAANRSVTERNAYILKLAAQRRTQPRADLITALTDVEEAGDRLSDEEICATCGILLTAGHETTSNLIGNGLLALLRHPEQLARLRDEPDLITPAVEELLRYDSPAQWTTRLATEDIEIGGAHISRGQVVLVGNGAANRDPARFSEPDALELDRNPNRHLAFGQSIHFCLGAALARLEGQLAIQTVLRRLPSLRLAATEFEWQPNFLIRGLQALPVAF